jgi:AraC family transcriptional regulator
MSNLVRRSALSGTRPIFMVETRHPASRTVYPASDDFILVRHHGRHQVVIDAGAGRYKGRGRPGTLCLPAEGNQTDVEIAGPHSNRLFSIPKALAASVLERAPNARLDFAALHAAPFEDPFVEQLLDQLWQAGFATTPEAKILVDSLAATLIAYLAHRANSHVVPTRGGISPRAMKRLSEYVSEHMAGPIGLTELAELCGLSAYHFCRAFKRTTGVTPHMWLTERRMERAKALISIHPDLQLGDVALSVGYSNQAAFATAFKRVTGHTPTQWRRTAS